MMMKTVITTFWLLFLLVGTNGELDNEHNDEEDLSLHRDTRMMIVGPGKEKGIMVYSFTPQVANLVPEYKRVMALYEANSCLRFWEYNSTIKQQLGLSNSGHTTFIKDSGCYTYGSSVSCCTGMACIHEIGHCFGLGHEHADPNRHGWLRINQENMWPSNRRGYEAGDPSHWVKKYPYDIDSAMTYDKWVYSSLGPTMTFLFPELQLHWDYFYMLYEIADKYKCYDYDACKDFKLTCENDGYQTLVYDKCACKCPTGLDPDTGCTTPVKTISSEVKMPKGQYALPMPKTGCPDDTFKSGMMEQYGKNLVSNPASLKGDVKGSKAEQYFCTRTEDDDSNHEKYNWPVGNYCIYRKGGSCPTGFYPGFIEYDGMPLKNGENNSYPGELPDSVFGSGNTKIQYCCQFTGFTSDPVHLPTKKPFILLRKGDTCQQVFGMRVHEEEFSIYVGDKFNVDGMLSHRSDDAKKLLYISYCYYTAEDIDCGGAVTLDETNREAVIKANSDGHFDMSCTWVVRGSSEDGTLVLNFEDFDVQTKSDGTTCSDRVEVRHARIGGHGLDYCGKEVDHSIRTITNKALIRFITAGASTSSFKVKIKWFPNKDLCYNQANKALSYNGKVNYTRLFTPCLPWTEVTKCHHHAFKQGDEMDNLEENYCRNPDDTFRPWCYTDTDGCKRNYCDVCHLEVPYDHISDCQQLRKNGFCTRNAAEALKYCASTCFDLLPSTPSKKFTEIECGPPPSPSDGAVVGTMKAKYAVGEKVNFKCKRGPSVVTSTCTSNGNWTGAKSSCSECPLNYKLYQNSCYALMENGKQFTYNDAKQKCKSIGGSIAAPRSLEESDVINFVRKRKQVWVPGTDVAKEGTWVYEDGTPLVWTNWNKGEPNNWGGAEDCIKMLGSTKWNDAYCWYTSGVVCSIPKLDMECIDVVTQCPQFLRNKPSMCGDFPDYAKQFCRKTCGFCEAKGKSCPVQPQNPGVTVSTPDATIPVGSFVTYSCHRFDYYKGGEMARACQPNGQLTGQALECADCPVGYKQVNGSCYGFIAARTFTFNDAITECKKVGGYIASPVNQAENDLISSIGLQKPLWIGANDIDQENVFSWGIGRHLTWTNWDKGEPKTSGRDTDCSTMGENKKWTNVKCNNDKFSVVCKIPNSGSDVCYDLRDAGANYNGKVSLTANFEVCLPWIEVTNCPHHSFKEGDERKDLHGNYCRNPDNSVRPWCYTDKLDCKKSYCNVCDLEIPETDQEKDCVKLRNEGFCQKDVATAIQKCASTCKDLLPSTGSEQNYLTIECDPPSPPADGEAIEGMKTKYQLGDKVGFRCKKNGNVVYSTCRTSGDWSAVGFVCQECPFGYHQFNDTCYRYVDKILTHPEAKKECEKDNGFLPTPRSQKENEFLDSLRHGKDVWLSKTHLEKDGTLLWSDDSKVDWNNWADKTSVETGGCPYLDPTKGWVYSGLCDFKFRSLRLVCAVNRLSKEDIPCSDFLDYQCPLLLTSKPTMCQDYPDFARQFCPQTCGICGADGIGCPVQVTNPNVTVSTTNATIPVGSYVTYKCVRQKFHSKGDLVQACQPNGRLTDTLVECEAECPLGFERFGDSCYRLIENKYKFVQAEAECNRWNGYVASPKSLAENTFIDSKRGSHSIWLGATDRNKEGTFVWQDGVLVDWTHWIYGEPNNWSDEEDCTIMLPGRTTWNDYPCFDSQAVVCQVTILDEGTCYDFRDMGISYDGKLNYTDSFEPCIPWVEATECPHHPFKKGDELDNLEENYCRNPDETFRPWCYIDSKSCVKKYCDVCQKEVPIDKADNCQQQKKDGLCTKDTTKALKECALTCKGQLANTGTSTKFTQKECDAPTIPSDSVIVGETKVKYRLGDKLVLKCDRSDSTATINCLTSGDWSSIGHVCQDDVACEDFLASQWCSHLFQEKPSMCKDYPEFAGKYCTQTCDICGYRDIKCPVQPSNPNITVSTPNATISVGDFVTYACLGGFYAYQGDKVRGCKTDGELTGSLIKCDSMINRFNHIVKVGPATITKMDLAIPPTAPFTGETDILKIKHKGIIVAWEFYSNSPMQTSFQVWRIVGEKEYALVGQNSLMTEDDTQQRYEVPRDEQITVEPDDILGIWNAGTGGVHYTNCDAQLGQHPNWAGVSWAKKIPSVSDLKAGDVFKFSTYPSCVKFAFHAEIASLIKN